MQTQPRPVIEGVRERTGGATEVREVAEGGCAGGDYAAGFCVVRIGGDRFNVAGGAGGATGKVGKCCA